MNAPYNAHNFTTGATLNRPQTFLTLGQAIQRAPSLTATKAHDSRSDKYSFISTADVLDELIGKGYRIASVQTSRVATPDKHGFERHQLRLQMNDAQRVGDVVEQMLLSNAHDGSAAFRMEGGLHKFLCSNGLTVAVGNTCQLSVPHRGNEVLQRIMEGTQEVFTVARQGALMSQEWGKLSLSPQERVIFAETALELRYPHDEVLDEDGNVINVKATAPVSAEALLRPKRWGDKGDDLFTTFNVVQEHLIKGGAQGARKNGRRQSVRAVNGIDTGDRLNRGLWLLANKMAELRGAAFIPAVAVAA